MSEVTHPDLTYPLAVPFEFVKLCTDHRIPIDMMLESFMADLCELRRDRWQTNGSDERRAAQAYFDRVAVNLAVELDDDKA